jgi:predicted HTH domain antitoxin
MSPFARSKAFVYYSGMALVTVDLPDGIADAFGNTAELRQRTVLEDAAIEAYREGRLSHRQVGSLLALDYWQTEGLFRKRGVPINYTVGDLEADRITLNEALDRK